MGGKISEFVLFHASLGDAVIITVVAIPFVLLSKLGKYTWLVIPIHITISISIELYALEAGRWAYNSYMPIIPYLNIGLTPTIQLGILGYVSLKMEQVFAKKKMLLD